MSAPVLAFFNNKGGVGKTSLVYHLAHMYAEMGRRSLVADLDPQANLSAAFIDDERLEELWPDGPHPRTLFGNIEPLLRGVGDIEREPHAEPVESNLGLLVGDLALARFEDELSAQWPLCLDGKERAFRVVSAFWRLMQSAALRTRAEFVLVDLGPNLGAINRAALVAADYLVVPLTPDLFSLQGLRNLGPTVRTWRSEWQERLKRGPANLALPSGRIEPVGYVVMQHAVRLDRPAKAYERWVDRIPDVYATEVVGETAPSGAQRQTDRHCIGMVKHYRSLMPMAQEARKPMFQLRPADGAIGAHGSAARDARENFRRIAEAILERCGPRTAATATGTR
jgi:cellulose biosynthesis protein BcsQ